MDTLSLANIRDGDHRDFKADDKDRQAIAKRLGLLGLERFEANVTLIKDGQRVDASGQVRAKVIQPCVATGEPVTSMIDEPFTLRFLPEPEVDADEEIELGEDEMDVIFHDGTTIALGDALADTLALALNPYPRSPDAEAHLKEVGVISEEEAGPFGALADLKRKMEGGG
ncbi:MAG: DUF177 domain-containing protein [Sphingomonas sp.]|nr:DUF177 domain-containing protein [Sphingomonas sp.]RZV50372.1 MAG: DUF177 domain-containing protein [Sphingomonadaceae bacterium]